MKAGPQGRGQHLPGHFDLVAHPHAGIVGSRLEDASGVAECAAHRAPSLASEFDLGARVPPLARLLPPSYVFENLRAIVAGRDDFDALLAAPSGPLIFQAAICLCQASNFFSIG